MRDHQDLQLTFRPGDSLRQAARRQTENSLVLSQNVPGHSSHDGNGTLELGNVSSALKYCNSGDLVLSLDFVTNIPGRILRWAERAPNY